LRSGLQAIAELVKEPVAPERIAAIGAACQRAAASEGGGELEWLSEHDAKALLAAHALAVPEGRVVGDQDDAVAALSQLGGRVVIKLSGPELRHKSELGALALDLQSEADVRAAYSRLSELPAAASASLFVEAMAEPGVEMIVAARTDAVVPALIVGLGGIWTELLSDAAVIPLPASATEIEEAIRNLRGAALLDGGRGGVKLAIGALAEFAAGIGELLLSDRLELIECNPVIVSEHGAVAADALIARRA
jgi:acyl-CoA synthetase (NDP forming)